MRELAIVFGIMGILAAVSWTMMASFEEAMAISTYVIGAGFLGGVPPALVYHWRLYRVLSSRDELPPRWYWNPIRLHTRLSASERARVLPWCYVGGAGFVVICIGMLLLVSAMSSYLMRA